MLKFPVESSGVTDLEMTRWSDGAITLMLEVEDYPNLYTLLRSIRPTDFAGAVVMLAMSHFRTSL